MEQQTLQERLGSLMTAPAVTIRATATLRHAAEVMAEELVGLLVVRDPRGILGVLSERDLVQALADGADPDRDRVSDVMSDRPITFDADATLRQAAEAMLTGSIRHLVVPAGDEVGVVSMRDVLAWAVAALPPGDGDGA